MLFVPVGINLNTESSWTTERRLEWSNAMPFGLMLAKAKGTKSRSDKPRSNVLIICQESVDRGKIPPLSRLHLRPGQSEAIRCCARCRVAIPKGLFLPG